MEISLQLVINMAAGGRDSPQSFPSDEVPLDKPVGSARKDGASESLMEGTLAFRPLRVQQT